MKLESIQIGKKKIIDYNSRQIETGMFKHVVSGPIKVGFLGLEGDEQADLKVHGGRDKALYAYSVECYLNWQKIRVQINFENGAMGENLSFASLSENDIFIGDTFKIGSAVIQAAQPRFPCYKLAARYQDATILKQFMTLARPGIYFRVLEEGAISTGGSLELIDREAIQVSILELFLHQESDQDHEFANRVKQVNALPEEWRTKFEKLTGRRV